MILKIDSRNAAGYSLNVLKTQSIRKYHFLLKVTLKNSNN